MLKKDKVYGEIEITEPILLELLASPVILRLKNISQYGIPDKYYFLKNFSRYEHCVGAMILLRNLGATLEEQVAGLLHDVSVLAFSHISDWVFGDGQKGTEDYHDSIHDIFVKQTDIPNILVKYGFSVERILDEKNFSLLERNAPALCADRVDYALREFEAWLNPEIIDICIKSLLNYEGEIVFSDIEAAAIFALNFLELQTKHWGGYEAMTRYHLFSKALKIAIDEKILSEKDFYEDENFVLDKFENIKNEEIQTVLKILRNNKLKTISGAQGEKIIKKFRYVDPKILVADKLVRLSEIDPDFSIILDKHRKINAEGLVVSDEVSGYL
ncbi:MAG: hypothetical protein WC022_02990 [Parcubacteria group bacterium]